MGWEVREKNKSFSKKNMSAKIQARRQNIKKVCHWSVITKGPDMVTGSCWHCLRHCDLNSPDC